MSKKIVGGEEIEWLRRWWEEREVSKKKVGGEGSEYEGDGRRGK